MANEEQIEILRQGVEVWNKWRKENPNVEIDLSNDPWGIPPRPNDADLTSVDLCGVNLSGADLFYCLLSRADLRGANLEEAFLGHAELRNAILVGANISRADLSEAILSRANLKNANLTFARLREAYLDEADLSGADLSHAKLNYAVLNNAIMTGVNLTGTSIGGGYFKKAVFKDSILSHARLISPDFTEADFTNANLSDAMLLEVFLAGATFTNGTLGYSILGDIDFSNCIGLETINHNGPSTIGTNTIQKSKGKIPTEFLRGCGLTDMEIESAKLYNPELSSQEIDEILYQIHDLRAGQPLQISPLFISYSHIDSAFVGKMEEHLNAKGIRFWRDVHHATAGRLEKQIDRAIRHNPTVLVILSENSIKSGWVEHEVRTARELEKETGRDVLCPVALDDSWKNSPWPKRVMEQVMEYNILDFSNWDDDEEFVRLFRKLIDGLELFYK